MVQMHLIQQIEIVTMLADELESTELISRHELEKMLYDNGKQLLKSINEK